MATYGEDIKILTGKALFTETIKSNTGTTAIEIADAGAVTIGSGNITNAGLTVRFNASNPTINLSYRCSNGDGYLGFNTSQVSSSDNQNYNINGYATRIWNEQGLGVFRIDVAASGIAGNTITWINAMSVTSAGAVTLGSATATTSKHLIQGNTAGAIPVLDIEGNGTSGAYMRLTEVGSMAYALGVDNGDTKFKIRANSASGTELLSITDAGAVTIGAASTTPIHNINGSIKYHGSSSFSEKWGTTAILGDDETVVIGDSNTNGFIFVHDISAAYGFIAYLRGGNNAVTIHLDISSNATNTDTDNKWCVYYSGSNYYLKNRWGASRAVSYKIQGTIA